MGLFSRLSLAVFALALLLPAAPASAEGIKVEIAGTGTYVYLGGSVADQEGSAGVCVGGTTGFTVQFAFPPPQSQTCPTPVADTTVVTLPPSGPSPECTDLASCQAFVESLIGGGGGGGGAPTQRACTSSTGGAATCIDFGGGNYIVLDPPDDGQGELGFCTTSEQAPAGPGYYFLTGPSPDGDAGAECPGATGATGGTGGETTPPPSDGDGDGVSDSNDRCPTTAAATSDGCPAQSTGGSQQTSGGSERTSDGSSGSPQSQSQSRRSDAPEIPRVDVATQRLDVSRRGRTTVPLTCKAKRTACRGVLRLTATRRTSSGRRVRVVLARAQFLVQAGQTVDRKVRFTKAGRQLLARKNRVRATARTAVASDSGQIVRRERLVLRRG